MRLVIQLQLAADQGLMQLGFERIACSSLPPAVPAGRNAQRLAFLPGTAPDRHAKQAFGRIPAMAEQRHADAQLTNGIAGRTRLNGRFYRLAQLIAQLPGQ